MLDRPLTPRSIVASLLLGMHPPRIRGALLVRWCAQFGIAEGTTRVALSRMVERGELRGRDGVYELVGRVADRQAAQEWSLAPTLSRWDGGWRMGVVTASERSPAQRVALREAARRLRLAEQREGVWIRPTNLPPEASPADSARVVDAQCRWWTGTPDGDPVELARELFAPARWAERAQQLLDRLDGVTERLVAGDLGGLPDGFVAGAAALAHVRADPLLPEALLPASWPGDGLRSAYAGYRELFGAATARFFRATEAS